MRILDQLIAAYCSLKIAAIRGWFPDGMLTVTGLCNWFWTFFGIMILLELWGAIWDAIVDKIWGALFG